MKQDREDLTEMINSRNELYVKFFQWHLPDRNVRCTGNPNAPIIVIDNSFMTNTYVKNYTIYFTDGKPKGSVIHTFKLSSDFPDRLDDELNFRKWFTKYPMKKCYTLHLKGTPLYVDGTQIPDYTKKHIRYPTFCAINPNIFYTKKFAQKVIDDYIVNNTLTEGLNLEVV